MPVDPIAVGDIVSVMVVYYVDNQTCIGNLAYRCDRVPTGSPNYDAGVTALLTALSSGADSLTARMASMISNQCLIDFIQGQRIRPVRSPFVRVGLSEVGLVDSPNAPSVTCISISKRVDVVGRGRTGHWQQGGCPANDIDLGRWEGDTIVNAGFLANNIKETLDIPSGGKWVPGIQPVGTSGGFNEIVNTTVQETVRSMHRRTVGLGI